MMNSDVCYLSGDILDRSDANASLQRMSSRNLRIKLIAVGSTRVILYTSENKLMVVENGNLHTDITNDLPSDDRNVLHFAAGHSLIILTDKSMFRNNMHSRLALGNISPSHVKKLISKFSGIAIVTHNSDLFICGSESEKSFKQVLIDQTQKFCHASFGSSHSLVLSESGDLYTKGENSYGQLGINFEKSSTDVFTIIEKKILRVPVKFAECGYFHTIAITIDNEIYGVGWNAVGELGDGTVGDKHEWVKATFSIPNNNHIIYLSVGYQQSFIVLTDGSIYCCGFNNYGGLGLGDKKCRSEYETFPKEHGSGSIQVNKPIAGGHFTFYCLDPTFNIKKSEIYFKTKLFSQHQTGSSSDLIISFD